MKKFAILSAILFLAALILLPGTGNGKYNVSKSLVADGYPLPPFPPPNATSMSVTTLVADGYPLPPFPPPGADVTTTDMLMADGYPLPPFPPKPPSLTTTAGTLVADGYPLPPFPPVTNAAADQHAA